MSEREEIEAYFAQYVDAFAGWDFDAVAALSMSTGLFTTPAGISRWTPRGSERIAQTCSLSITRRA